MGAKIFGCETRHGLSILVSHVMTEGLTTGKKLLDVQVIVFYQEYSN